MRSLLALLALLFVSRNAKAQMAQTYCDSATGQPVIQFYRDYDDSTKAQLQRHEEVHVAQLTPDSLGTCQQKLDHIKSSPQTELEYEVPAYTEQLRYAEEVQHYTVTPYDRLVLVSVLADAYKMTPGEVVRTFAAQGVDILGVPK